MSINVANCTKCGKVYVKNPMYDICPACVKEIDLQCEICVKYLREHRGITLEELSDATEIPQSVIIKFIRDGRISVMGHQNLSYPCEVCGTRIREKNMCESCRLKLKKDVSNSLEDHRRVEDQRRQENKVSFKISDRLNERPK
jgi:flagellar operon protein (TIGR03826 family)